MSSDVIACLTRVGATRVDTSSDLYEIDSGLIVGAQRYRGAQLAILEVIRRLRDPRFLRFDERPTEWGLEWIAEGRHTWRVPETEPAATTLRDFLHYGNWTLYAAPAAVASDDIPDFFRGSPSELQRWIDQHGVVLLIDSWHDDTAWCVALGARTRRAG